MGKLALAEALHRKVFFEREVNQISQQPFRDMRIQEGLLAAMIRQFEVARIDEARDGPLFQQIDAATPPETRSAPQRSGMVLSAGMLGILLSVFLAWSCTHLSGFAQDPKLIEMQRAWGFRRIK